MPATIFASFDGECINNNEPDPSRRRMRYAWTLGDERELGPASCGGIAEPSSNAAEYIAIISLLDHIDRMEEDSLYARERLLPFDEVVIRGDSKLTIEQLRGNYTVRSDNLRKLHTMARCLLDNLSSRKTVTLEWVPRERNPAGILLEKTR